MQQTAVTLVTEDEIRLEGRLATPDRPAGAAVVCHPHPQFGGSMSSLLVPMIQRAIAAAGWAALRFNFRGVGRSEGRFEQGLGERRDVTAALDLLAERFPEAPIAACGWSFGSLVSLAAAAGDDRVGAWVGVAPPIDATGEVAVPIEPPRERLRDWTPRALAIIGTNDEFATPDSVRRWADATLPGRIEVDVFEGADHLFNGVQAQLADRVARFVTGR